MKNRRVTILCRVLIAGALVVLATVLWRGLVATAPAPEIGTTLSEILEGGEFIPKFGVIRTEGESEFFVISGQVDTAGFPSAPAIVVLDKKLTVVDSTDDSGDDPAFMARWGENGVAPVMQPWGEFKRALPTP